MSIKFIKDTTERAVTAFLASYLGAWVNAGANFEGLTNTDSLKTGVVAAGLDGYWTSFGFGLVIVLSLIGHRRFSGKLTR